MLKERRGKVKGGMMKKRKVKREGRSIVVANKDKQTNPTRYVIFSFPLSLSLLSAEKSKQNSHPLATPVQFFFFSVVF